MLCLGALRPYWVIKGYVFPYLNTMWGILNVGNYKPRGVKLAHERPRQCPSITPYPSHSISIRKILVSIITK